MSPDDHDVDMTPQRAVDIRAMLLDALRETPEISRRRRRRRAIVGGIVGLVVVAGAATGATVIASRTPVTNQLLVRCATSDQPRPDGTLPGSSVMMSTGSRDEQLKNARSLCADMWRQGALTRSASPTATSRTPGRVPRTLTVCVARDGSAVVVPDMGREDCQDLGLTPSAP